MVLMTHRRMEIETHHPPMDGEIIALALVTPPTRLNLHFQQLNCDDTQPLPDQELSHGLVKKLAVVKLSKLCYYVAKNLKDYYHYLAKDNEARDLIEKAMAKGSVAVTHGALRPTAALLLLCELIDDCVVVSRFVGLCEGLCESSEPTVNPSTVPQDYRGAGLILE